MTAVVIPSQRSLEEQKMKREKEREKETLEETKIFEDVSTTFQFKRDSQVKFGYF
jgi:hypothetical protein